MYQSPRIEWKQNESGIPERQNFCYLRVQVSRRVLTTTIISGNRITNAKSIIIIQNTYQHES
jgi:hypothetical protein